MQNIDIAPAREAPENVKRKGGRPPKTGVEIVVIPAHCVAGGASGRLSRCSPAATLRWMTASCVAVR